MNCKRNNFALREAMYQEGILQRQLAEIIGIGESTMRGKFREEMSEEEQLLLIDIIRHRKDPVRRAGLIQQYIAKYRRLKRHEEEFEVYET